MVNVSQGTMRDLRVELFRHMESLPIRYFDTHAHGDIMSVYTNDVDTLRQLMSQSLPQLLNSSVTIVTSLGQHGPAGSAADGHHGGDDLRHAAGDHPPGGPVRAVFCPASRPTWARVNGYIEEMMDGQKVVKVFCHEEESIRQFRVLNEQLRESADKANTFANITMPLNANLGNISYVLCAVVGAALALNGYGGLTLGALVSFFDAETKTEHPAGQPGQPADQQHRHGHGRRKGVSLT